MVTQAQERIAGIYADGWSRIVATMIRLTRGDWDLAEECAQEAFAAAASAAGEGCPISGAMKGNVEITVEATLAA